jgi:hypothetical protein
MIDQGQQINQQLAPYFHDYTKELPDEPTIFHMDGQGVATAGNIILFSGKAKAGKSHFISALVASHFAPGDVFKLKLQPTPGRPRVAWIDTEMSTRSVRKVIDRIVKYCGAHTKPPQLDVLELRPCARQKRIEIIRTYLQTHKDCAALVVDQVADLIGDFNDARESGHIYDQLEQLVVEFNVVLIVSIHLGKTSGESLGHLGALLERKAQIVLAVEKEPAQRHFKLSVKACREVAEVPDIYVSYATGHFEVYEPDGVQLFIDKGVKVPKQKAWDIDDELTRTELLKRILTVPLKYNDLLLELVNVTELSESTVKRIITRLAKSKHIFKGPDEYYKKRPRI